MTNLNCTMGMFIATTAAAAITNGVRADIMLVDLHWQFYQGGYVQDTASDWAIMQNHYEGNLESNVVAHTIGGSSFRSTATMDIELVQAQGYFNLSAFNQLHVAAAVEPLAPQGLAHAFASLSAFLVRFAVTESSYLYTGSETLRSESGESYRSGSIVGPGEYLSLEISPGGPLTETAFVEAGESDDAASMRLLTFEFTVIPSPAAAWLVATMVMGARRRRE